MEQMTVDKVAQGFYDVYMRSSDGKNHEGKLCPIYDSLPVKIKQHWRAVAREAVRLSQGNYLRSVVDR